MAYREKVFNLGESVIEVEQVHSYLYPQPGCRGPKQKPTSKEMLRVNLKNRHIRIRRQAEISFDEDDCFVCLTYDDMENPSNIDRVKMDFTNFMKKVKRAYAKRGYKMVLWMRNIERIKEDKRYHIHLVIKRIEDTDNIINKAWSHGLVLSERLLKDYDYDRLVKYITKTPESDWEQKIDQSHFSQSHNMRLPDPIVTKYTQATWTEEIVVPEGYLLVKSSIKCVNDSEYNYKSRSFTFVRLSDSRYVKKCGANLALHQCSNLIYGIFCKSCDCCSERIKGTSKYYFTS